MELGIASFAAIVVICVLIGQAVKLIPNLDTKAIPVICGLAGAILGAVAFYIGIPDFPANDILNAIAVGIVSGLGSSGAYDLVAGFVKKSVTDSTTEG